MNFNVNFLREAINEALESENDYNLHLVDKPKIIRRTSWDEWEKSEAGYRKRDDANWFMLYKMCRMINVDCTTAIAIEKSIRRNMQYQNNWEREPKITSDESYRRAVKA